MNQINYIGGLIFLASLTLEDVREQKISFIKILIAGLFAFICQCFLNPLFYSQLLLEISPGILLLLLSLISKESIGYGDGLAVVVLGLWVGWFYTSLTVCIGVLLTGGYSLIQIFQHKKSNIPFIPFLLLGMEVILFYE